MKAIIFSHQEAREIDGVIDLLRQEGMEISRFNLCRFPEELRLTLRSPELEDCKNGVCGWVHNTGELSFARHLTGLDREVATQECEAFLEAVLDRQQCQWLNAPVAINSASNKANQLRLARKLGIPTPEYCITNDPAEVKSFAALHEKLVMKALRVGFLHYGPGPGLKFYTKLVTSLEDLDDLSLGPQIFQERIDKVSEIRVTIVDGMAYSIAIDLTGLPESLVDVRELDYAEERNRFLVQSGMEQIEAWSTMLVEKMGLGYAGLDWTIDKDGRPFFLELNPCGSFKWFEMCGAGNITKAIAEALIARCKDADAF